LPWSNALSLSLYDASIPVYLNMLKNLQAILDKGEAHAKANGIELSALADAKLAPDMGNLVRQIQLASDAAKGGAARLAQVDSPAMPDVEATFPELRERIGKTIAFLESLKPEQVSDDLARPIVLTFPGRTMTFTARDFLFNFSLPNFLFHVTTAYAVLRNQGVPVGKMDYLAGAQLAAA
jgi:hypothetical protein